MLDLFRPLNDSFPPPSFFISAILSLFHIYSGALTRASVSQQKEPGVQPCTAGSSLGQVRSLCGVPNHLVCVIFSVAMSLFVHVYEGADVHCPEYQTS